MARAGRSICPASVANNCLGADIAFGQGYAVFGKDAPFAPGKIQRLDLASGVTTTVADIAGTSFSSYQVQGMFLVGDTHEPKGSYPTGDTNVHLYASADGGQSFTDVFQIPWQNPSIYAQLKVQFAYPNGDFPIQVSGYGTIVGRLHVGPTPPPLLLLHLLHHHHHHHPTTTTTTLLPPPPYRLRHSTRHQRLRLHHRLRTPVHPVPRPHLAPRESRRLSLRLAC